MPASNKRYVVWAAVLAICIIVCGLIYSSRSKTFSQVTPDRVVFLNAPVVQDWIPQGVYNIIVNHLEYYLATNNLSDTTMTIATKPVYSEAGELEFDFTTASSPTAHSALVRTVDFGDGITSTGIFVDGEAVDYGAVDQLYGMRFKNFESLGDSGLSGQQVYSLQRAIHDFAESGTVTLNDKKISQTRSTGFIGTSFDIAINKKVFHVRNSSNGLTGISLTISDENNKEVYTSGRINLSGL